jgi:hypothetical protein
MNTYIITISINDNDAVNTVSLSLESDNEQTAFDDACEWLGYTPDDITIELTH